MFSMKYVCVVFCFSTENDSVLKVTSKIAELVLLSGETINITDASQDPRVGNAVSIRAEVSLSETDVD